MPLRHQISVILLYYKRLSLKAIAEIYLQVSKELAGIACVFPFCVCVYVYLSLYFLLAGMDSSKLGGAISPIWPYSLRNLSPFSVVLKICSEELKSSRPLIVRTLRYSFNWAYDRNALYIILVFVAPPLAASRICDMMSVLLLYRTLSVMTVHTIKD